MDRLEVAGDLVAQYQAGDSRPDGRTGATHTVCHDLLLFMLPLLLLYVFHVVVIFFVLLGILHVIVLIVVLVGFLQVRGDRAPRSHLRRTADVVQGWTWSASAP